MTYSQINPTKVGGFKMEKNKIHQGDCLELMKKLQDNHFDLIITDPPYGIGINKMNFVTSGAIKVGGAYRNDYSNHNTYGC